MLRLDECGARPITSELRWTLWNLDPLPRPCALCSSRDRRAGWTCLLPVLNRVARCCRGLATETCKTPRSRSRASACAAGPGSTSRRSPRRSLRARVCLDEPGCDRVRRRGTTRWSRTSGPRSAGSPSQAASTSTSTATPFTDDGLMQALVEGGRLVQCVPTSPCRRALSSRPGCTRACCSTAASFCPIWIRSTCLTWSSRKRTPGLTSCERSQSFKPDMPAMVAPPLTPWWTTLPGNIEDFGRRLSSRIYYWDPPDMPVY